MSGEEAGDDTAVRPMLPQPVVDHNGSAASSFDSDPC
jgi:hypothetical protein